MATAKYCRFCKEKREPDYKEPAVLHSCLSEHGRILGSKRTGACAKHQKALTIAIKRARYLGLLPFVTQI